MTRALLILTLLTSCSRSHARSSIQAQSSDSATVKEEVEIIDPTVIHRLTDDDYKQAADELGIDIASIKAVIEIEAGQTHQGFYKPNQPIINFDLPMFKKWAARHGIKLGKYSRSNAVVFARPNAKKYGSYQAA
ncbi:N-acetylmuramidase domain-containing protein, partial [uncultured Muribaculum sp.]